MDVAFVLGNGISRRGLPLNDMSKHGHIYGCNALFRDYIPHVLVATDKPIALHIEETGYPKTNKFYTRRPTKDSGALEIPRPYYGFSSGPVAVALAGGYFVYLTIKLLLQGVLGSIKGMAGIITALDNRVKTMNHDVIRIDTVVSNALGLRPDVERISRADGKNDARRD